MEKKITIKDLNEALETLNTILGAKSSAVGEKLYFIIVDNTYYLERLSKDGSKIDYENLVGFSKKEAYLTVKAMIDAVALYKNK